MNEIETIFCKLLKCERSSLYLDRHRSLLNLKQYNSLEAILKKRIKGEPLQYLMGEVEFMGCRLKLKPGVLIPRPETGILVEEALKFISSLGQPDSLILDIGTGSGNIAVALAKFLKTVSVFAIDISDVCLSVARANARLNRLRGKIKFLKSDMFSTFEGGRERFDFIVSNPPYISSLEYNKLPQDVRREPESALLAGEDGLLFYRRIEEGARGFLKPGGIIFLEITAGLSLRLVDIFLDKSVWRDIRFVKDYNGIERVAIIRRI